MTTMTKKELLALAKEAGVVGRHDMPKEGLAKILGVDQDAAPVEAPVEAPSNASTEDHLTGNYIPTTPFRGRPYSVVHVNREAYDTLPPQAKKIFDFMVDSKIVSRGEDIVKAAVAAGYLKTQQDPAVLFAFYARKLENAGVRLTK